MSKHSIDDIIKKALEQIESGPREADWSSFESKMDNHGLTDFDEYVKSSLSQVEPSQKGAWGKFEDKYAEELDNPHPVDKVVKENLTGHEAPFVESSWAKLAALLDLTDRRERDLLIKKVVEVLTVALILFIFLPQLFNETPTTDVKKQLLYAQSEEQQSPALDENTLNNVLPHLNADLSENNAKDNDLPIVEQAPIQSETHNTTSRTPDNTDVATRQDEAVQRNMGSVNLTALPGLDLREMKSIAGEYQTFTTSAAISDKSIIPALPALAGIPDNLIEANAGIHDQLDKIATLPFTEFDREQTTPYPQIELVDLKPEKDVRFGLYVAPMLTHIYTPKDDVYTDPSLDIQPYGRVRAFSAIGIEAEKQYGDITLGGNLGYSKLSYMPPIIIEKYAGSIAVVESDTIIRNGYQELSLVNLEMQMASVSLFLRKYFPLARNMRMFAHFGSGINMVLQSDYLVQEITKKGDGTKVVREMVFDDGEASASTDHVKLRNKNFEGGILEGGNFNRNSYMDIEMGAGLEYDLNSECSVYVASVLNYSPFSDGLGPNRDRFNSLNLQFGIKQLF